MLPTALSRSAAVRSAGRLTHRATCVETVRCCSAFVEVKPGSATHRGERRIDLVELRTFCRAFGINLKEFVASFERAVARRH